MQENDKFNEKDVTVMKLLHYFITCCGYNPILLHGGGNEIWLEKLDAPQYKIIRIVSDYIHNDEQYSLNLYKTKRVVGEIKKKTFKFNINVLSIFMDLGDNVNLTSQEKIDCISLNKEKDLKKYKFLYNYFPDIDKKMTFTEKGVNLFVKITNDINKKNQAENKRAEEIFASKKPIITYLLIAINVLMFLIGFLLNKENMLVQYFSNYGPYIRLGEWYRLFTCGFLHADVIHLFCNMWALYVVGSQVESFFGRGKYLFIYFFSLLSGSLLSMVFSNVPSIGASGAIFGLFAAILYFGNAYRLYFGNVVVKQILPVIIINLTIGFLLPNIDIWGHIGGLVGGILASTMVGTKYREDKINKINATIIGILFLGFLIFMGFIYKR